MGTLIGENLMLSPLMTGKHSIWGTLNLISLRKNPSHQSLGHIIQKKDLDYLYSRLSSGHQSVLKARIDQKIGMNERHIPVFFFFSNDLDSFQLQASLPLARCGPLWPVVAQSVQDTNPFNAMAAPAGWPELYSSKAPLGNVDGEWKWWLDSD